MVIDVKPILSDLSTHLLQKAYSQILAAKWAIISNSEAQLARSIP